RTHDAPCRARARSRTRPGQRRDRPAAVVPRLCAPAAAHARDAVAALLRPRLRALLRDADRGGRARARAARRAGAMNQSESREQPPGWSDGLPPCTDCGHCCFFPDERYVLLFDEDLARLGERAAELTHWIKGRCFLRMEAGHCVALKQDGERWLCSVYEIRPGL